MNADQPVPRPAKKRRVPWLACGGLILLIVLLNCVIFPNFIPDLLAQIQSRRAADSYLNTLKADQHIPSWNFSGQTLSQWYGDGMSMGSQVDFSGEVMYEDGSRAPLTLILRNNGILSSENWRVDRVNFGPVPAVTPAP
jgi:hypothetical protein